LILYTDIECRTLTFLFCRTTNFHAIIYQFRARKCTKTDGEIHMQT
jgi:hypothetical protein